MTERDIGREILDGIREIKAFQQSMDKPPVAEMHLENGSLAELFRRRGRYVIAS